jgi:predicted dehydrogenase/threonine dehydrogenase-like Zn-dependent dehydrogenase
LKILGQKLKDGSVNVIEAPDPMLPEGFIRVRTLYSAISPGTEGGKVITGKKSLIGKARAKPQQAMQALEMVKSLGLKNTILKVRAKLEGAQPLGYSLCGEVIETGNRVECFQPGDLVACAGGGYANHADQVVVPVNLAVRLPEKVKPESAAFATLGAIALQGVRLADPTIGETAVVIGLGILGQLAGQILKANGCRVAGVDISEDAVKFALQTGSVDIAAVSGVDSTEALISEFTRGRGADLTLICAGTSSNQPVELAGAITRKKGRVSVTGAVGMDLPREPYYRKEISFAVSCSYGPGRYDLDYEEGGVDYPYAFVRWTEGRNIEAVLDLIAAGTLDPGKLVTHRIPFEEAPEAYELIAAGKEPFCGILLEYPDQTKPVQSVEISAKTIPSDKIGIGCLGAGSFAQTFLLPPLKADSRIHFSAICTQTGLTAADTGERMGFGRAVGSLEELLSDENTDAIVVAARHDMHGPAVLKTLTAGKPIFVEKPLCLTLNELNEITKLAVTADRLPMLMVGFNRRFSKAAVALKKHMGGKAGPVNMMYRVNAGHIPREHWTQDPEQGGGRIIGEVCHFVDLMQYFCEADPVEVTALSIATEDQSVIPADNTVISLRFADGSTGSIGYFAEGAKGMPKERFEIFGGGKSGVIDNFTRVEFYAGSTRKVRKYSGKGHAEEMKAFVSALSSGEFPIPVKSMLATTLATFRIVESQGNDRPRAVDLSDLVGE